MLGNSLMRQLMLVDAGQFHFVAPGDLRDLRGHSEHVERMCICCLLQLHPIGWGCVHTVRANRDFQISGAGV